MPFSGKCYNCRKIRHRISECRKLKKAVDKTDDLILCIIIDKNGIERSKKGSQLCRWCKNQTLHVNLMSTSQETGMMLTTDGEMFFTFIKNTLRSDSGASCQITNNDSGLYDVADINKFVQRSSGSMPTTKKIKYA